MNKVLICDSKHDYVVFDVSTPELEDRAYRALFELGKEWAFYYEQVEELERGYQPPLGKQHYRLASDTELYRLATHQDDIQAIKQLINRRNSEAAEYETFTIVNVQ